MRISDYGTLYTTTNHFLTQKSDLAELQRQLTSGQKNKDLPSLGVDLNRFTHMKMQMEQKQSYIDSIETLTTRYNQTADIYTQIHDIGDSLSKLIDQATTSGQPSAQDLVAQATSDMQTLQELLNTKGTDGLRVLGAGARGTNINLTTAFSGGPNNYGVLATLPPANLIPYSTVAADQAASITKVEITSPSTYVNPLYSVAAGNPSGYSVTYSTNGTTPSPVYTATNSASTATIVTSGAPVDPATSVPATFPHDTTDIGGIITAVDIVKKSLSSLPGNFTYAQLLSAAKGLLTTELPIIEKNRDNVLQSTVQLKQVEDSHQNDIDYYKDYFTKTDGVDTAEVSAKITSLTTQLESSYKVSAQLLDLNLVSYLT